MTFGLHFTLSSQIIVMPPLSLTSVEINLLILRRYLFPVLLDQTCPWCTVCPRCQAVHLDLRPDDAFEQLLLFRPEDRLLEPVSGTCSRLLSNDSQHTFSLQ